MKKRRFLIFVTLLIIAIGFVFKDLLIQTYVSVFNENLEIYAEDLLADSSKRNAQYGLWDVDVYPEEKMVEFMTGGFGLTPSSTYKGFYYSADNTHKVFSIADAAIAPLKINGDNATWTDGTDNHGSSYRIIDKWFWFEASF